jgi:hypothetical protein
MSFPTVTGINFWRKYVFAPERELWVWPEDYALKYEEVYFHAKDGVLLHGWWIPKGKMTLLFAHGNGGNISHRVDIAARFHREGFSLITGGTEKVKESPPRRGPTKMQKGLFNMFRKNSVFQPHELFLSESLWGERSSWNYLPATVSEQPFLSLVRLAFSK